MKTMKKVFAALLTLAMILCMCVVPTLAATGDPGSITIDNAVKDKTYTIYQVFALETDSSSSPTAYKYTLSTKWAGLKDNETFKTYFDVDATDSHLTKKDGFDAAAFATFLNQYQKDNSIANDGTAKATSSSVTFSELPLGYYFVQTDLGSLCSLDTTNPSVTIKEKNAEPSIDKQVKEGENYGNTSDASIGDTVEFKTTVNVIDGNPTNYVIHDTMSTGLTFDSTNGITSVKVNGTAIGTTASDTSAYYELVASPTDTCTFEIKLYNLKTNDVVVIEYKATLNSNAAVGTDGNTNKTKLTYSEKSETTEDTTTTYTWEMPIYKYTGTKGEESQKALSGAKFVLYKGSGENIQYAKVTDGKLSGWTATKTEATELVSGTDGKVSIKGLDAGTYYLEETEAPAGYNKLADAITVVITSTETNNARTMSMTQNGSSATSIDVQNNTGSELPSTGGIGTTIFYVIGGVLVAGAAVALVVKKRMSGYEE